jgi:hypothetical protein
VSAVAADTDSLWQQKTLLGRKVDTLWTRSAYMKLLHLMHNGNDGGRFYHGFWSERDAAGNKVQRHWRPAWSKQAKVSKKMAECWDTICGRRSGDEVMIGFAAKGQKTNVSTWAAMDFDGKHSAEDAARAETYALHATAAAAADDHSYFLTETSGSGGWHLYIYRREPLPVEEWTRRLKKIADDIGAPIEKGVCEIFPPDGNEKNAWGTAIRAPGTYNGGSNSFSRIVLENVSELLEQLPPVADPSSWKAAVNADLRNNIDKQLFSDALLQSWNEAGGPSPSAAFQLALEIPIDLCGCEVRSGGRHEALKTLVGRCFPKVGRDLTRHLAEYFFHKSAGTPHCRDIGTHMIEFDRCWQWMLDHFLRSLNPLERGIYEDLGEESWRDAFRIMRGFAWVQAAKNGGECFGISQRSMARRLLMSGAGISYVLGRLTQMEVIEKVDRHRPGQSATYRWKPSDRQTLLGNGELRSPETSDDPF